MLKMACRLAIRPGSTVMICRCLKIGSWINCVYYSTGCCHNEECLQSESAEKQCFVLIPPHTRARCCKARNAHSKRNSKDNNIVYQTVELTVSEIPSAHSLLTLRKLGGSQPQEKDNKGSGNTRISQNYWNDLEYNWQGYANGYTLQGISTYPYCIWDEEPDSENTSRLLFIFWHNFCSKYKVMINKQKYDIN